VALVEKFDESLALLERLLPTVFQGIVQLYAKQGSSRVNNQRTTKSQPSQPPQATTSSSMGSSSSSGSVGTNGRLQPLASDVLLPTEPVKYSARHNATAAAYLSLPPDVAFFIFNKLKHEVIP